MPSSSEMDAVREAAADRDIRESVDSAIERLARNAAESNASDDAMRFSQAVLNLINAKRVIKDIDERT